MPRNPDNIKLSDRNVDNLEIKKYDSISKGPPKFIAPLPSAKKFMAFKSSFSNSIDDNVSVEFSCPMCKTISTDSISIPCGHNLCSDCA